VFVKKIKSKEEWENFIQQYKDANFLHSWSWGKLQKKLGNKIFRFGLFKQKELQGVFLLIKKKAKRGTYLVCPAGPLIDWQDKCSFEKFIETVKKIGKKEGCFFCRVRPQLKNNSINKLIFKKKGFISAPMHLHAERTLEVDLQKQNKQLLKEMRKNTRYYVRKSAREGVKIKTSTDVKDIDILYRLQMETARRHNFVPFSKEYFQKEFEVFNKDGGACIFKAHYKNKILSIALVIFYNQEAVYHYAASSTQYRKIPSSYGLQWGIIKEAKKRGMKRYNLWGIAPEGDKKHRFSGVTLFKTGFGGKEVDYLHSHDLPLKFLYWGTYIFEILRKKSRNL